jgi:hypothetical protein
MRLNGHTSISDDLQPDGKAFNLYLPINRHHVKSSELLESDPGFRARNSNDGANIPTIAL